MKYFLALFLFTLLFVASPKSVHAVSEQGLIGWWKFDEATGTIAQDSSGNNNNGILNTFTNPPSATSGWTVNGKKGRALIFDGASDYITTPKSLTLNASTGFSVSAWFKVTGTFDGKIVSSTGVANDHPLQLINGHLRVCYSSCTAGTTFVNDDKWHFAMMISSGNNQYVYLDGNPTPELTNSGSGISTGPAYIGADSTPSHFFKGSLDDVRIYNRSLSLDEMRSLYLSGVAKLALSNETGLVGWWKLDEATGTIAQDSSGLGNNGTTTGLSNPPSSTSGWTAKGKRGGALNFDQSDDIVKIPASTSTDLLTNRFTLSAWVKPTALANQAFVVGKSNSGCSGYFQAWALQLGGNITANQTMTFSLTTGGSRTQMNADTGRTFLRVWSHVVATWDGSTMRLYRDGESQGTPTAKSGSIQTSSEPVRIATGACGVGLEGLKGTIDDVRVYNRALTSTEVKNLYQSTGGAVRAVVPNETGLVGWWKFDEATGTIAQDSSGNKRYGLLNTFSNPPSASSGWSLGKRVGALLFDGSSDFVSVQGDTAGTNLTSGTLSAWIKTTTQSSSYDGIVVKQNAYGMFLKDGVFMTYDWGAAADRTTGVNIDDQKWHHVVEVFDSGVTNGTYFYIDGVLRLTTSMTVLNQTHTIEIGRGDQQNQTQNFAGKIDDVQIYNRKLTPSEVKNLYLMGATTIR